MRSFLILFFCAVNVCALGQQLSHGQSADWVEGTIITNDDEELKGLLRYNDLQGILSYRNGNEEKTFSARQIRMFRLVDGRSNSERLFYSLEFEDRKFSIRQPFFFELIREFKTFAVLSKAEPVQFNQAHAQSRRTRTTSNESSAMRIQQFEVICFMSPDGLIEPFLEIETTIKNGPHAERQRNGETILNSALPEKYFGERAYAQITTFVRHNELRLNNKEDFLKVLEYFGKYLEN